MTTHSRITRVYRVNDIQVICQTNEHGHQNWNCSCAPFALRAEQETCCSHIADAIDQAMQESAAKLYWHARKHPGIA